MPYEHVVIEHDPEPTCKSPFSVGDRVFGDAVGTVTKVEWQNRVIPGLKPYWKITVMEDPHPGLVVGEAILAAEFLTKEVS